MQDQKLKEEALYLLRELEQSPEATQRSLSSRLGISLGKTNYLLKALIKKGFIKVRNFSTEGGKINKVRYILTKEGLGEKIKLTHLFLERKKNEYETFRKEYEHLVGAVGPAFKSMEKEER